MALSALVSTTIFVNLLCTHEAHNILTTVMTNIVVDKSTDNAKPHFRGGGWEGLAATFDLAAFRKDMIAPVKKSVNHSKTVTSIREMRRIRAIVPILSVATRR